MREESRCWLFPTAWPIKENAANRRAVAVVCQMMTPASPAPSLMAKPRFDGIFVALTNATMHWTEEQWLVDLQSMVNVGMTFFILPALADAHGQGPPTEQCPLGLFSCNFNLSGFATRTNESAACFRQVGSTEYAGGTVMTVLQAAAKVGLKVHLGAALTSLSVNTLYSQPGPATAYAALQNAMIDQLWAIAGDAGLQGTVAGFYTEAEESNWWPLEWWQPWTRVYLAPVSAHTKSLREDMLSWASPYSLGNRTRFPAHGGTLHVVDYPSYAKIWARALHEAPELDLLALQDAIGAQGNSLRNASDALGNLTLAARRVGRQMAWSNVELFETWPRSCEWSPTTGSCHGRHPAPFARIREQMTTEYDVLRTAGYSKPTLIAWEWYSCLSPNGGRDNPWARETRANYDEYKRWLAS